MEEDVVSLKLICDGCHTFKASKSKLCDISPYFEAMFHGGFAEEDRSEIELKGVTSVGLESLLNFAKDNDLLKLTHDSVFQVLQAASMLQFAAVQRQCRDFISSTLSSANASKVVTEVEFFGEIDLYNKALKILLGNFAKQWRNLNLEILPVTMMKTLLGHQHLSVLSEFQVFEVEGVFF
jgi:hypothetical protein